MLRGWTEQDLPGCAMLSSRVSRLKTPPFRSAAPRLTPSAAMHSAKQYFYFCNTTSGASLASNHSLHVDISNLWISTGAATIL